MSTIPKLDLSLYELKWREWEDAEDYGRDSSRRKDIVCSTSASTSPHLIQNMDNLWKICMNKWLGVGGGERVRGEEETQSGQSLIVSQGQPMNHEGLLRRSLRRVNPFRSKLFRLPATPRLSRNKKIGNGEDVVTDWNFERASFRGSGRERKHEQDSPDTVSLPGNSKQPCSPPDPQEAELNIHSHMQSLLVSGRNSRQYLQLPNTRYAADGEVSSIYWNRDFPQGDSSPNQSTISLLNTGGQKFRERVINGNTGGSMMSRTPSLRPKYPLNGIPRPPSTEPTSRRIPPNLPTTAPLFELDSFYSTSDLEETFIGREWVFREIYQAAIVEKVAVTVVEGGQGSGKSTILNQIILNSSFYSGQASDTLDSGCVPDASFPLNSRNYEWLRAVAARMVAYHVCNIQSSSSCSIPEFVCNLGALLARSPILKSYADILEKNAELCTLLTLSGSLHLDPLTVFKRAISEPLAQLKSSDQGCLVIVIDGLDEAEFHRSEDGRSIGTFLCQLPALLPSWLRFIVSCDEDSSSFLEDIAIRRIRIDESTMDERVIRDNRMLVEYRISMVRELEDSIIALRRQSILDPLADFAERIVFCSNGNMLYIKLLLRLVETGKLHIKSLATAYLPKDLHELYNMYMDLTFTSLCSFQRVATVLNVLLAALRPMERNLLFAVLNAGSSEPTVTDWDLNEILAILSPLLCFSTAGIALHHASLREWLLKNTTGKYQADARNGHILHALAFSRKGRLESDELFELAHHLLKAHPYKYMNGEYIPELTSSKEGQIAWVQRASKDIGRVLINSRNMHFPNTKVTRLLLLAGADPGCCTEDGETLGQVACRAGHWQLVALLIHYGAELYPEKGPSLLSMSARHGHSEMVHTLYAMNPRGIDEALVEAAANGHLEVVSFLLGCKWPSDEEKMKKAQEAINAAAGGGHTALCQYLVDSFSYVDIAPAMCAACEQGSAETVQFFLSRGASLSSLSWPADRSALHCAVESGSWDLVVAVLSLPESSVDAVDARGRTPLLTAAMCAHVGLMDMLINKGASINHRDDQGWTALMHAVHKGHLPSVQLLIDREADIGGRDVTGRSLAHIACGSASRVIIDRLIEAGMMIEEKDQEGFRPIETSIRSRNRPALEALLRRGARLRSSTWQMALDYDAEALFTLLAKLLDDAGILYRKKRLDDAMHRLHYALNKVDSYVEEQKLFSHRARLLHVKLQVLLATARVHRREGRLERAVAVCHEAATLADTDDLLFEVLLLRAKCNFDRHDVDRARADARAASQLRPADDEARHLLNTLLLPTTNIARL